MSQQVSEDARLTPLCKLLGALCLFSKSKEKEEDCARVRLTRSVSDTSSHFLLSSLCRPPEVADVCAFLASDDSRYITGARIEVTGTEIDSTLTAASVKTHVI